MDTRAHRLYDSGAHVLLHALMVSNTVIEDDGVFLPLEVICVGIMLWDTRSMFKHLSDFGYVRNVKEAIGFYLAWFLVILVAGVTIGFTVVLLFIDSVDAGYDVGVKIGTLTAIVIASALTVMVARTRNLPVLWLILATALTIGLAGVGGSLLGLIVSAYLSTRKPYPTAHQ